MPPSFRGAALWLAFCLLLPPGGCKPASNNHDPSISGSDEAFRKLMASRYATRMAYNGRRFDELEARAETARMVARGYENRPG